MSDISNFFDSEGSENTDDRDEWNRRISWSQFKTYQKCPKKWELKYKEGNYIPDPNINLIFGTAIHEAIQEYLETLYNKSVSEAENLNLKSILVEQMRKEFEKSKKEIRESEYFDEDENPASHIEMKKYLMDGEKILKSFKSNRTDHFNTQKTDLVGIELQVEHNLDEKIDYVGYLDVVLRNKKDGSYKIIDLKTSKEGWDKWKKKDKLKVNQLVSYKAYYAEMLETDPDNIDVEYIILRRNLSNNYYRQSRIQTFSPPDGSITRSKVRDQIKEFIEETYNSDGSRKDKEYEPDPGKFKCCWCPFSKQFDGDHPVCDQGGERFEDYPEGMKGYVDDKWIDD